MTEKQLKEINNSPLSETSKKALIVKYMRDENGERTCKNTPYTSQQYSDLYNRGRSLYDMNKVFAQLYNKLRDKEAVEHLDFTGLVKQFRNSFKLKIKEKPSLITKSEYDLHFKLLREEVDEYLEACEEDDVVGVFDALIDIGYILFGAVLHHGMQDIYEDGFKEVHASNMSKLDKNGKPIYRDDGKVMKSKDYCPPELKQFISEAQPIAFGVGG